jgi:hypothetical protein
MRVPGIGSTEADRVNSQASATCRGAAQHRQGLVAVGWLAPDTLARDLHGAVAEAVDGEITTDPDDAGSRRGHG